MYGQTYARVGYHRAGVTQCQGKRWLRITGNRTLTGTVSTLPRLQFGNCDTSRTIMWLTGDYEYRMSLHIRCLRYDILALPRSSANNEVALVPEWKVFIRIFRVRRDTKSSEIHDDLNHSFFDRWRFWLFKTFQDFFVFIIDDCGFQCFLRKVDFWWRKFRKKLIHNSRDGCIT